MPSSSSLALRHGRLFPLDALPVPELENSPVSVEVRGTGQTVRLQHEGPQLTALPEVPPTAAIEWAGAAFPLYVRSARYDLDSGRVHVTVQRPMATQADMAQWAALHGAEVPRWVHSLLGVTQHPTFQALSAPLISAVGALTVLRSGHLVLPALLAGALGCRALARRGVPMEEIGQVMGGQAVEFDAQVCLHAYVRMVAALDAQLKHSTDHAAGLLSHLGQVVDLGHTQLTLRYVNHHGVPDRPRHGVGLSPHEITLVAGHGGAQGMGWQVSGFLQGSMRSTPNGPIDPVALSVNLGLNVPRKPELPPARRSRRSPRPESPSPTSSPASPPASPRHGRTDSVTDRLRPVLRELARVSAQGTLQLRATKTLYLESLWPGLPDLLRSCTVRTAKNRRLLVRTINETPSSPHTLILEAPHRQCVGLELGLGTLMQRRLPALMQSIQAMPGASVVQEIVNALLPTMSLTVYLRKVVLRPSALLEEGAPWVEVHFSIRRLPVLPGCAGAAFSRLPKMKKMLDHKVCLSGSLSVGHESPAWAVSIGDEEGSIQTLRLDMPVAIGQGASATLANYLAELVALYPPVLHQILAEKQASSVDLSAFTSAAERALKLQVDRSMPDTTAVAVTSHAPHARVSARLDLPEHSRHTAAPCAPL